MRMHYIRRHRHSHLAPVVEEVFVKVHVEEPLLVASEGVLAQVLVLVLLVVDQVEEVQPQFSVCLEEPAITGAINHAKGIDKKVTKGRSRRAKSGRRDKSAMNGHVTAFRSTKTNVHDQMYQFVIETIRR